MTDGVLKPYFPDRLVTLDSHGVDFEVSTLHRDDGSCEMYWLVLIYFILVRHEIVASANCANCD